MNNKQEYDNLAVELLIGFHKQFAENQRTREQSFLKIVGFLGAVVLGYAYVFKNIPDNILIFSFSAIASIVVLFFGCGIVTVIAYSFRRDQYINARIRNQADIIGENKPFPSDYNPTHIFKGRVTKFFWMPDIFLFFFWIFPIFQVLIMVSYSTKLQLGFSLSRASAIETLTIIVSFLAIFSSLFVFFWYGNKLKKKLEVWEKESKRPS
jgi:hypothetical protein